MARKTFIFALFGAAFALAPLSVATADFRSDWEKFESGVKKAWSGAKHEAKDTAEDVEDGTKKSMAWSKRKAKDAADELEDKDDGIKLFD